MDATIEAGAPGLWEADHRARLVRFCYRYTGDPAAAEEVAQETLLRAWQRRDQLRDAQRDEAWLLAIARNQCRRWWRDRPSGREVPLASPGDGTDFDVDRYSADNVDLQEELERDDLAILLDRALGLLPVETHQALIARYVDDAPQAEIAHRLGVSEGAVAMRLQRGTRTLRRVLTTAFPGAAEAWGLRAESSPPRWRPTRIWCPWCGSLRLEGLLNRPLGLFRLRCPQCGLINDTFCPEMFRDRERVASAGYSSAAISSSPGDPAAAARPPRETPGWPGPLIGTVSHRAAFVCLLSWGNDLYQYSWSHPSLPCPGCGAILALHRDHVDGQPGLASHWGNQPRLTYHCGRCHHGTWNGQYINLLALPAAQRFWTEHPRMHRLPVRTVEADGRPAAVAGFASRTGAARLEVVYARDTLAVLGVHRTSAR
jgi:RNA polymerase sigma-70 factor (ECF subfamily)